MKKIIALLMALLMVTCLSACSASATTTTTTTTTTTDADGNTTTVTETTTNATYPEGSCGAAVADGEQHKAELSIKNATEGEITAFYACVNGETEWSNLLGEDQYIANGNTAEDYLTMTYSASALNFDFGIKVDGGDTWEFNNISVAEQSADGFTLVFTKTADGYSLSFE